MHFLKSKLCVGCTKGFEIVDLETLDTQGLLDPADSSLDFVQKRESARPIAIYRVDGDFLLCYDGAFPRLSASCNILADDALNGQSSPFTSTRMAGEQSRTGSSSGRACRPPSVCPVTLSPAPH